GFSEKGLKAKIYRCSKKDLLSIPGNVPYDAVYEKGNTVVILAVGKEEISLPFEEIELPSKGLNELLKESEDMKKKIERIDKDLDARAAYAKCMKEYFIYLQEQLEFNEVRSGMGKEEILSYLQGFCPAGAVEKIKKQTEEMGWAVLIEDPEENDDVPTYIRNPKWISIIEPVFDFMNTVPGYREYDISLWFLSSLSLFFAMLIGDGGYGLLFLVITFLMRRKFQKAPSAPFTLFYVFSGATMIWGAITGTWFGSETLASIPVIKNLIVPKLYSYSDDPTFIMQLCFTIGIIHISIAHAINILRMLNSVKALAQAGWILIMWTLYFLAGNLILGKKIPGFCLYLFITGIFLVAAFSNPKKNFIVSFLLGLADLPLTVISSFGDIVSYIRLFAVGYASLAVAMSFNDMAANLGWNTLVGIVGSSLILFIGHGLNIVLGLMAVVVHGVRLNMLEFSSHMGMTWSGIKFDPFKVKSEKLKVES
ncbi:MAG: V-type ATP synthase subunit I, partial [Candidatus Aureabacteria bacterium]|nr:V-type ATP synthase subunit I [Candidatus Auribacterota bacterium]